MRFPLSRFTVNGNSMTPTLSPGQDILSFNWAYIGRKPKVGEIIVLSLNGKELIKRVTKLEGKQVFVEGDNKAESTDSRDFGAVNLDQIVGKVVYQGDVILGTQSEAWRTPESRFWTSQDDKMVDCPNYGSEVVGIYGRKDAVCRNCGFKLTCCGEP